MTKSVNEYVESMAKRYPQIKTLWPAVIDGRHLAKFMIRKKRQDEVTFISVTPYYSTLIIDADPYDLLIAACKEYGGVQGHLETFAVDDVNTVDTFGYGHRQLVMAFRAGADPGERKLKEMTDELINATMLRHTMRVFPVEYTDRYRKRTGSWAYSTC